MAPMPRMQCICDARSFARAARRHAANPAWTLAARRLQSCTTPADAARPRTLCRRQQQAAAPPQRSWEQLADNPRELLDEAGLAGSGARGAPGWAGARASAAAQASGPACAVVEPWAEAAQAEAAGAASRQQEEQQPAPAGLGEGAAVTLPAVAAARYYQSFDLAGEAIARRIGFDRTAAAEAEATGAAPAAGQPLQANAAAAAPRASAAATRAVPAASPSGAGGSAPWRVFGLTVEAARRLPPTILASSCTDLTVPWCAAVGAGQ